MNPFPLVRASWMWPLVAASFAGLQARANDDFGSNVGEFLRRHCVDCHSEIKPRGGFDMTAAKGQADVVADFRRWSRAAAFVRDGEMPPGDHPSQPTLDERRAFAKAVDAILAVEARKNAGDPGHIPPRRLSNVEFDGALEDLTGVAIDATKEFPVDPAGGEGFDNTGESLRMSPSLLRKFLGASRQAASHLVLTPRGVAFAPFPVGSNSERRKFVEGAIIDFYRRRDVDVARYVEEAWRHQHRGEADRDVALGDWAAKRRLSPRYLELVAGTLDTAAEGVGLPKRLGELWRKLPAPGADGERPPELRALVDELAFVRRALASREGDPIRSNAGNWPIEHLERRAEWAAARDRFDLATLRPRTILRTTSIKPGKPARLIVRVDLAVEHAGERVVVLRGPLFSKHGEPPRNDEERKKHETTTLRELLAEFAPESIERLRFGQGPAGIDGDSFAIEAPATVEIEIPEPVLARVADKRLLIPAEIDAAAADKGAFVVRAEIVSGEAEPAANQDWSQAVLLADGSSAAAKSMADSAERFCRVFPNRFFYVDEQRGLEAGFHLVEGYFRDDQPLVDKVLTDAEVAELQRLWDDLHFVMRSSESLIRGFVWFERSERQVIQEERFDFVRAEDPRLVESDLLNRFERVYLEKMGVRLKEDSSEPVEPNARHAMIHGFFDRIRDGLTARKETLKDAEKRGRSDLEALARRAYRRPLTEGETESLRSVYQRLRERGEGIEDALRGEMQAILLSPAFLYRDIDQAPGAEAHAVEPAPLSDQALASRLGFFLWSSIPDEELLQAAARGELRTDERLIAHTRRMTRDPRVERFAREFFGQWLRYRDFSASPADPKSFPGDSPALRKAMFEEPTRTLADLIARDGSVTELLSGDATFVNGPLAEFYGGGIARQWREAFDRENPKPPDAATFWIQAQGSRAQGRGGLFGMAVVLAKNSVGQRTSPVKRGFWTVHRLLGQHFPPPPPDVPELPKSEKDSPRSVREMLAEHASHARCAMCHRHFDAYGVAMEGFDPLGRARTVDLAGRAIDPTARIPVEDPNAIDGDVPGVEAVRGIPELADHVLRHRRRDFVRTLCRKFIGYALGRSVELSDEPLLDEMEATLERDGGRFSTLFEKVVTSPQFKTRRGAP